jgi:excisionase family DNA binding protein
MGGDLPASDSGADALERVIYRVPDVVAVTGLSRSTIYREMASGALFSVKVGGARCVPVDALRRWLQRIERETRERML